MNLAVPAVFHFRRARRARRRTSEGQTLVEFALVVFPFLVILMGTIEFGLAFNGVLNVEYASRNAALLAAEAGNSAGADCVILQSIEDDMGAPTDRAQISTVQIYWAEPDGDVKAGKTNVYTRGAGTTTCTYPDGSSLVEPYQATSIGYQDTTRCNFLKGCGTSHPGLDNIGVQITYFHTWRTPMTRLIGGSGSGFTIVRANAMRMEPVL